MKTFVLTNEGTLKPVKAKVILINPLLNTGEFSKDRDMFWNNVNNGKGYEKAILLSTSYFDKDKVLVTVWTGSIWAVFEATWEEVVYPYKEGDSYFTIEGNSIVESVWDLASEELHDICPKLYYNTLYLAKEAYLKSHIVIDLLEKW